MWGCQALSGGSPQSPRRENDFRTRGQLLEMFPKEGLRPENALRPVTGLPGLPAAGSDRVAARYRWTVRVWVRRGSNLCVLGQLITFSRSPHWAL